MRPRMMLAAAVAALAGATGYSLEEAPKRPQPVPTPPLADTFVEHRRMDRAAAKRQRKAQRRIDAFGAQLEAEERRGR